MSRGFWVDGDTLLNPVVEQLRDLANRIDNWNPTGNIKEIQEDSFELLALASTVNDIAEALKHAFPPEPSASD